MSSQRKAWRLEPRAWSLKHGTLNKYKRNYPSNLISCRSNVELYIIWIKVMIGKYQLISMWQILKSSFIFLSFCWKSKNTHPKWFVHRFCRKLLQVHIKNGFCSELKNVPNWKHVHVPKMNFIRMLWKNSIQVSDQNSRY